MVNTTDFISIASKPLMLEWQRGFRPDAVKSVTCMEPGTYRITDTAGKNATLAAEGLEEPALAGEKLVIGVSVPEPDPKSLGELTGQVLDMSDMPVPGAQIALVFVENGVGSSVSAD
jgi:hypothetical protein